MRDTSGKLWCVLREGGPLVAVFYEHSLHREDLLEQIQLLLPEGALARRTGSIEDAFADLDTTLLLTPDDESTALQVLEGRRDALLARRAPVMLFLLRGGEASKLLSSAEMAGLASWLGGRTVDPSVLDQIDTAAVRQRFVAATGRSPEDWLRTWHTGELADNLDNNLLSHQAALVIDPHEGQQ